MEQMIKYRYSASLMYVKVEITAEQKGELSF